MPKAKLVASIDKKRESIDRIDAKLLIFLNKRAAIVDQIKQLKLEHGLEIHDPHREKQILNRLAALSDGPLSPQEVKILFSTIIQFFRERQRSRQRSPKRASKIGRQNKR